MEIEALIGEAVKAIVERAEKTLKPIVIEELDFSKKKSVLKENSSNRLAWMLSSFVYSKFRLFLESRASSRYGLTVHHAAALVIARRLCRFSERTPQVAKDEVIIPNNKGDQKNQWCM